MSRHGQLAKYFASTPAAKFAILTNGIKYLFFTDMEKEHLLDPMPFLEVDLTYLEDKKTELLEMFCKDRFNSSAIFEAAIEARDKQRVKDVLKKELTDPSDEFVKFLISSFFSEKKNQQAIDRFRPCVKAAIADCISNTANLAEYKSELDVTDGSHPYSSAFTDVVKNILEEAGHSTKTFRSKIKRDYFYVSYRNCWLCIFNHDKHGLNVQDIQFFNLYKDQDNRWFNREITETHTISSTNDILKYKNRIIAAAADIDEAWRVQSQRRKESSALHSSNENG